MDSFQKYLVDNADTVQVFQFNRNATPRSSLNRRGFGARGRGSWNGNRVDNSHHRRGPSKRKLKFDLLKLRKELAKEKQKNLPIKPPETNDMEHENTQPDPPVEPQNEQSVNHDVTETSTTT